MPNKCIIPSCNATHRQFPYLNFFSFVRNDERKRQWIDAIEKGTGILLDILAIDINDRICSRHFNDNDILTECKERGDFKFLKKDAVPSLFNSKKLTSVTPQAVDLQNKCRLCFKEDKFTQITINDSLDSSQITIIDAVQNTFSFSSIDLTNPEYPQRVCSECFNLVTSAYQFKNLIIETDSCLREKFENEYSLPFDPNQIDQLDILPPAAIKIEEEEANTAKSSRRKSKIEVKKEVLEEPVQNLLEIQMEIDEERTKTRKKYKYKSKIKDSKKTENRTCKKCKFSADTVLELLKHVDDSKDCSECYEPTYECYICRKKFMLDVKKREHVRRDHVDYASKDCPHCIRSRLKTSTAYELHVRQHFAQPDFLCTNCGKGFFKKELYDLHMRQHDDKFWLFCFHCEYKCKIKSLMTTHLKHHFGIRPFVCDKCSKPFHKSNALIQHIFQVHKTTNKGCYRCEKCDYCFLHRRDIIRHNVYCEGQSKNPINCPRVRFAELDPNCVIKELLNDEINQ